MSGQLHLLRGVPPNINGEAVTLDEFLAMVPAWKADGSLFGSWTRNRPRRLDELQGGSVYFVHSGETRFRMPLVGLERVGDFTPDAEPYYLNHTALVCEPEIIFVQAFPVRFLRGWRYLTAADAPPDLPAPASDDDALPPDMARELRELGL